jgi:hypothetical protein
LKTNFVWKTSTGKVNIILIISLQSSPFRKELEILRKGLLLLEANRQLQFNHFLYNDETLRSGSILVMSKNLPFETIRSHCTTNCVKYLEYKHPVGFSSVMTKQNERYGFLGLTQNLSWKLQKLEEKYE